MKLSALQNRHREISDLIIMSVFLLKDVFKILCSSFDVDVQKLMPALHKQLITGRLL